MFPENSVASNLGCEIVVVVYIMFGEGVWHFGLVYCLLKWVKMTLLRSVFSLVRGP